MDRMIGVLLALLCCAPTIAAQSLPEIPKSPGTALPPPRPLPATPTQILIDERSPALPPLPGSVEDQYATELVARDALTTNTPEGNVFRFLPSSLIWQPPLAVKRDPRMQVLATGDSADVSLGGTAGLFRYDFVGRDASLQLDLFGVARARFSDGDLAANDYRFGIPLTWRRGWWSGKIAYEHTSAYRGDRDFQNLASDPRRYQKDELVFGLSRILYEQFRLYGHAGYALGFRVPGVDSSSGNRTRADVGFEWYDHCPTGFAGTPFLAGNAEWRGDQDGDANLTIQAGWLWRNPYQRFGTARIFVEHYRGQSSFGQLQRDRETFTSVGFGFDY